MSNSREKFEAYWNGYAAWQAWQAAIDALKVEVVQQSANYGALEMRMRNLQAENAILKQRIADAEKLVVMEFSLDKIPEFSQGLSECDVLEPVTAERCKGLVAIITKLKERIADAEKHGSKARVGYAEE